MPSTPGKLPKHEARARLEKLREVIDAERQRIHVHDTSTMSEAALDSLKHELTDIERQFPDLITADSPSQRVAGTAVAAFSKVRHTARMISLADVFSYDEVMAWDARWKKVIHAPTSYVIDLKLDGLAISLQYDRGVFVQAATRGDGFIGEDVTHTVKTIPNIPLRLQTEKLPSAVRRLVEGGTVIIRGEAVMLKRDFAKLNAAQERAGLPLFANPRNASAGTIRQLDARVAASRPLTFYAWELVTDLGQKTIADGYAWMRAMGVTVNPEVTTVTALSAVAEVHDRIFRERETLPFWIDGMVVKINDSTLYRRLGFVGKTPRAAVAWKFSAEQVTTIVENIVVQVGRTGAMTPVAHLQPVQVAGTTVARATLHNADEIDRLDVRVGDTVIIQKAGDIIPEVVRVVKELRPAKSRRWRMITHCPVCHQPVTRKAGEAIHFCRNVDCPAKKRENLYHFVSKSAFDITGLGPSTIDVLVDEDLVHEPADIFRLRATQLVGLPLFAEKKSENLIQAIADRRRVPLDRFIYGLGIRHVGQETARSLAAAFRTVDAFQSADRSTLKAVPDIGEVVAESIDDYLHTARTRSMITALRRFVTVEAGAITASGPLSNASIVVTGTLPTMSREEAEEAIRAAGGHATASVSAKTTAVVVGENPGSKAERAKKLGLPIWDEAELRRRLLA